MKKRKSYLDRNTRLKLYLEASKYSLDVSKLIFGGIILSGIMGLKIDEANLIMFGVIAALLTAFFGMVMFILGNKK